MCVHVFLTTTTIPDWIPGTHIGAYWCYTVKWIATNSLLANQHAVCYAQLNIQSANSDSWKQTHIHTQSHTRCARIHVLSKPTTFARTHKTHTHTPRAARTNTVSTHTANQRHHLTARNLMMKISLTSYDWLALASGRRSVRLVQLSAVQAPKESRVSLEVSQPAHRPTFDWGQIASSSEGRAIRDASQLACDNVGGAVMLCTVIEAAC